VQRQPFMHLETGARYRVVNPFRDFDGEVHPAGESWVFLGHSFLPYDDGLSLFVSLDGKAERQIRLQWRPEAQGDVIEGLSRYVQAVPP
jgi:hypothetical protein